MHEHSPLFRATCTALAIGLSWTLAAQAQLAYATPAAAVSQVSRSLMPHSGLDTAPDAQDFIDANEEIWTELFDTSFEIDFPILSIDGERIEETGTYTGFNHLGQAFSLEVVAVEQIQLDETGMSREDLQELEENAAAPVAEAAGPAADDTTPGSDDAGTEGTPDSK